MFKEYLEKTRIDYLENKVPTMKDNRAIYETIKKERQKIDWIYDSIENSLINNKVQSNYLNRHIVDFKYEILDKHTFLISIKTSMKDNEMLRELIENAFIGKPMSSDDLSGEKLKIHNSKKNNFKISSLEINNGNATFKLK